MFRSIKIYEQCVITPRSEEMQKKINDKIADGVFWSYVADLIEKDCKNEQAMTEILKQLIRNNEGIKLLLNSQNTLPPTEEVKKDMNAGYDTSKIVDVSPDAIRPKEVKSNKLSSLFDMVGKNKKFK